MKRVALSPTHLCISPGPGVPSDAGVSKQMIERFAGEIPLFGVCLGHQALVEVFGGTIVRAERLMHGKTSAVAHDGRRLFDGLPNPFEAGRYHSLIAERERLPGELEVTAWTPEGESHGRAPPGARRRGRAVPPGKHPDARRPATDGRIPAARGEA